MRKPSLSQQMLVSDGGFVMFVLETLTGPLPTTLMNSLLEASHQNQCKTHDLICYIRIDKPYGNITKYETKIAAFLLVSC